MEGRIHPYNTIPSFKVMGEEAYKYYLFQPLEANYYC